MSYYYEETVLSWQLCHDKIKTYEDLCRLFAEILKTDGVRAVRVLPERAEPCVEAKLMLGEESPWGWNLVLAVDIYYGQADRLRKEVSEQLARIPGLWSASGASPRIDPKVQEVVCRMTVDPSRWEVCGIIVDDRSQAIVPGLPVKIREI